MLNGHRRRAVSLTLLASETRIELSDHGEPQTAGVLAIRPEDLYDLNDFPYPMANRREYHFPNLCLDNLPFYIWDFRYPSRCVVLLRLIICVYVLYKSIESWDTIHLYEYLMNLIYVHTDIVKPYRK